MSSGKMNKKIPGSIKLACSNELKQDIKEIGEDSCILITDEIMAIDGVVDAWFTSNKKYDIVVEIEVSNIEQSKEIESKIKSIEGVDKDSVYTSVAITA